jgi:hypothetical protein
MNCVVVSREHWDAQHPAIAKILKAAGYTVMKFVQREDLGEVYLHCEATAVECPICTDIVTFGGARYPARRDLLEFDHVMTYPLECPECGARAGDG